LGRGQRRHCVFAHICGGYLRWPCLVRPYDCLVFHTRMCSDSTQRQCLLPHQSAPHAGRRQR
jgi:hypothetical protein